MSQGVMWLPERRPPLTGWIPRVRRPRDPSPKGLFKVAEMEDVRGCSYVGPALGTENNLREPPPPISFWNVDFGPRIPHTPESPTTLAACLVTSVAGHLVAITQWGGALGVRLVLVIQRGPAAQAPVSCGDFLTVLRPPDASGCGNHAPPPSWMSRTFLFAALDCHSPPFSSPQTALL